MGIDRIEKSMTLSLNTYYTVIFEDESYIKINLNTGDISTDGNITGDKFIQYMVHMWMCGGVERNESEIDNLDKFVDLLDALPASITLEDVLEMVDNSDDIDSVDSQSF